MDARWWILICCSIIGFSTDFFTEEPSSLVQRLTGTASACANQTDYCTYLSIKEFNLLFSTSAWASAFGAVFAGFMIDRHGCRVALFIAAASIFVGGFMIVAGTYAKHTAAVFGILEIGNVIAGLGGGAISVICHRVKASWFLYKELALAFSVHILCGRLGSATSYLLIGFLIDKIGMQSCLWIGFALLTLAACSCIVIALMDERGSIVVSTSPTEFSAVVVWSFLKSVDGIFWCFAAMVFLFYGSVSTFTANGPNFIAKSYGYSESEASFLVGIIYDVSLFALLFGWLTDRYGRRENWMVGSAVLLFLAFAFEISIPHFPAWVLTTLIGFGYTIFGPTFWSSVPLVVLPNFVGTALGVLKFCHFAGVGSLTAIAGVVLNATSSKIFLPWLSLMIMLVVTSGLELITTSLMAYLNTKTNRRLTPSQIERDLKTVPQEVTPLYTDYGSYSQPDMKPLVPRLSRDLAHILINK